MFEEALFEMSQHPDRSGKADIYNTACRSSSIDHDFRGDNEYIQEDSFRAPHSPPLDLEPTPIRRDAIIVCERLPLTHCYCNEDARRDVQDWISILQASKRGDVNGSQKTADPSDKMNTAEWIGDSNTSAFLIQPSYAFNNESLQIPTLAELPAAASLDPSYSSDSSYPHYYHGFPTEADVDSVQIHRHQDEKWNERYDQLREFYRVHGHSVVPYHYKDHPALGGCRIFQC
jgi:Helicase associated domain